MINKNYQTAKFYARLYELRGIINNDLLPLGTHIETADTKLFESLEVLAADVDDHLKSYELSITKK